ncbi:MAG: ATP synthase F1 subunit gamma [Planctomycetaceae bacterium]|nr:ATP synthase F1 subunit gamma [Planctomycetaceae bacterium]
MAKARALDKRRKSIRNIRKITRTMELISTATFRRAMDRAVSVASYTDRINDLVAGLVRSGTEIRHSLLRQRQSVRNACLLVLSANRGLCGGYNGGVLRQAVLRWEELNATVENLRLEVSGKRGISGLQFRGIRPDETFIHFEDRPSYDEVEAIADRYLEAFETGAFDRLDVVYTKFESLSRQYPVAETLLPIGDLGGDRTAEPSDESQYEFLPSAESILDEVVPMSFKMKLFKCFLDAAASEQVARMLAMKAATENADQIIAHLTMTYNRARQGQITNELLEVIAGADALSK